MHRFFGCEKAVLLSAALVWAGLLSGCVVTGGGEVTVRVSRAGAVSPSPAPQWARAPGPPGRGVHREWAQHALLQSPVSESQSRWLLR